MTIDLTRTSSTTAVEPKKAKIVFFDLDGTLIGSSDKISKNTFEAIAQLQQNNIYPAIATGRAYFAAKRFADALKITAPSIFYAGALAINPHSEEVFFEAPMSKEEILPISEEILNRGFCIELYGKTDFYIPEENPIARIHAEYLLKEPIIKDISQTVQTVSILKLVMATTKDKEKNLREVIEHFPSLHFGVAYIAARPDIVFCNITSPNASREKSLDAILSRLELTYADTASFGDGESDVPLLKLVGTSVAMGNANEYVKSVAKYITKSVDEDGVSFALKALWG